MSGRSLRVYENMARQINPFCTAQFTVTEGAASAHSGGYRAEAATGGRHAARLILLIASEPIA
jgi:hypothetical protein